MKKRFHLYIVVWAVLLALFNVIAFVSVGWAGQEKYTLSFWIGYVFITVMFIGQFICTYMALRTENAQKLFYNLSLITTSYSGLILSFVFGGLCMLISPLPYWVGVIACAIVLAANVLSVVKAAAAIDEIERIDTKVKAQTFFIKSLMVDADTLMASAKTDELREEAKKVYEVIRYSDPMANTELSDLDAQIERQFNAFSDAIKAEDAELAKETAYALVEMVERRNQKCKLLK